MKKYNSLIALAALVFAACGIDDTAAPVAQARETKTVEAQTTSSILPNGFYWYCVNGAPKCIVSPVSSTDCLASCSAAGVAAPRCVIRDGDTIACLQALEFAPTPAQSR